MRSHHPLFRGNLMNRLGKSAFLLAAVGLWGCEDDPPAVETQTVGLHAFQSCDALLDYFQDEALSEVGFWGWGAPEFGGGRAVDDAVGAPQAGGEGGGGAPTFSDTNVQVAGVDEPDQVKTDGRYLYVARSNQVLIYEAADLSAVGAIEIEGYIQGLLLDGDRLVVLGSAWQRPDALPAGLPARFGDAGRTALSVYDVADPAAPVRLRRTEVEGGLVAARVAGGTLRAVIHFDGAGFVGWDVGGVGGGGSGSVGGGSVGAEPSPGVPVEAGTATRVDPQVADWEQAWRDAVHATTLADWVPYRIDQVGDAVQGGPVAGCGDFQRPGERAGHGVTAVISIDLDVPDALAADPAVVMAPGVVYANGESLYVATVNHAGWLVGGVAVGGVDDVAVGSGGAAGGPTEGGVATAESPLVAEPERQATQLHRFAIGDTAGPARYTGSGRVFGVPLNSFSLDEYAGHLRIGTTEDRPAGTTNHLWVLGQGGETGLQVTGAVNDLADTERVQAMRFLGARGFMVTFRQVDPLFCFDLADPTNPRQLGELKVPGFSTYLHPLDDDHLIGLGQAATEEGRVTGMQLSLFDVSDMAAPALDHALDLGAGWSQALYDHHAFTFWAPAGLLMLPVDRWDDERQHAGLDLFRVDADTGFEAYGSVDHAGLAGDWRPVIQRSLVIGDTLVALSDVGLTVHDLETLAEQHAVAFPQADGPGDRDLPVDEGF